MRTLFRFLCLAACGLATSLAGAGSLIAVEYYHGGYGHYVVTASPQEIVALDSGRTPGWTRTGESFGVFELDTAGAANVCRFWSGQTFVPKSSHFYTPIAAECTKVKGNRDWLFEGEVFAMALPDSAGACAGGTVPLYRLYNDGQTGAPNHRYTTRATIRSQMVALGWVPEGSGIGVIGCVPAQPPTSFTIAAAADIGQCFGRPAAGSGAASTAALVSRQDVLVLTAGDNTYDYGTPEEFTTCFAPTWGAFKDRIFPTVGNHEYYTVGAEGYFGYFGAQAGPDRRGYYSFDYGGWHFISLNSVADLTAGSEQSAWLAADLAQSRDTLCTIALLHYPAFNSGAGYGSVMAMRPVFAAAAGCRCGAAAVGARARLRAVRAAAGRRHRGSRARRSPVRRRHRRPRAESVRRAAAEQRVPPQRELGHPAADARPGQLRLAVPARRWRRPDRHRHRDLPPLKRGRAGGGGEAGPPARFRLLLRLRDWRASRARGPSRSGPRPCRRARRRH